MRVTHELELELLGSPPGRTVVSEVAGRTLRKEPFDGALLLSLFRVRLRASPSPQRSATPSTMVKCANREVFYRREKY